MAPDVSLQTSVGAASQESRQPAIRLPVAILSSDGSAGTDGRAGQPALLVCLRTSAHEHRANDSDVLHVSLMSAGILAAFALGLLRRPAAVMACLRFIGRCLLHPVEIVRVPSAFHLVQTLSRRGISSIDSGDPAAGRLADLVRALGEPIPDSLADLPVDWSRLGCGPVSVHWLSRRINSIAAEVSFGDAAERAIVKRQRDHAGESASERWQKEHAVLTMLDARLRNERYRVPKVLLADAATSVIVMERAPGQAIDSLFAAARTDASALRTLRESLRGAGAWLAALQRVTEGEVDGRLLLADVQATARRDLVSVAATDGAVKRRASILLRSVDDAAVRFGEVPLRVVGHHDDYWPGNVFWNGERVTVIDFESYREGFALEDVAFFLLRTELLARRFRLDVADLQQCFLDGYAAEAAFDRDALSFFLVTTGLRGLARGMGRDLPLPQRIWTRRTLIRSILAAAR